MVDFSVVYSFLVSLGIGALVGIERQRSISNDVSVAGVRTFILIALLGTSLAMITEYFSGVIPAIFAGGLIVLICLGYYRSSIDKNSVGLTTEISEIMVFAIGFMVYHAEMRDMAVMLGIATAILLAMKERIHHFARVVEKFEFTDTLKFCAITFIILPLLPNNAIDPWGVIVPYKIWLMVVLISGISYLGYIFVKILGPDRGVGLTGFMGGLTSSTAVATVMASKSRENPGIMRPAVFAAILASSVMFIRVLVQIAVVNSQILDQVMLPMAAMFAASIIISIIIWHKRTEIKAEFKLETPFALSPALKFGVFFMIILLFSNFSRTLFGDHGLYIVGMISGLADVDAITLSTAAMAAKGEIETNTATTAITIAVISNTIMKLIYSIMLGSRKFAQTMGIATLLIIASGVIALAVF
jgi:uncharacterized membrane protein (DUF4010 family)